MAISFVDAQGTTASTNSLSPMPAHQAGDLLVMFAWRENATAPDSPSGWNEAYSQSGNGASFVIGWKFASSSSETSGTWNNAQMLICHSYRGAGGLGAITSNNGNSGTVTVPALTFENQTGTSWALNFTGHSAVAGSLSSPPSGMTQRTTIDQAVVSDGASSDTNGTATSYSGGTISHSGSGGWHSIVVEILMFPKIALDAVSNVASVNGSSGTLSLSWTHTPNTTQGIAVVVGALVGQSGTNVPSGATYGGRAMTVLAQIGGNNTVGSITLFGILDPPSGAQTVNVTMPVSSGTGLCASAVSYTNVAGFDAATQANGQSSNPTLSWTNVPYDTMTVGIFGGSSPNTSGFVGMQRTWNATNQTFVLWSLTMGDTMKIGPSISMSTDSQTSWVAAGVRLLPAMPFNQMF